MCFSYLLLFLSSRYVECITQSSQVLNDGSHPMRNNDCMYNVLVYGLEECKEGTSRLVRQREDMDKVVCLFSGVDESLSSSSTKDHLSLGKYIKKSTKPRPILVKFAQSDDILCVLTKSKDLKKPIFMKPDLSPLQRKHESILLKEKWSLIQSGESRNSIKDLQFQALLEQRAAWVRRRYQCVSVIYYSS